MTLRTSVEQKREDWGGESEKELDKIYRDIKRKET